MTSVILSDSGLAVGGSFMPICTVLHLPNNKSIIDPFHASYTKYWHVILIIPNK